MMKKYLGYLPKADSCGIKIYLGHDMRILKMLIGIHHPS